MSTPEQIEAALGGLPAWTRDGASIRRSFRFTDFAAAVAFVNRVAVPADELWHHPDVDIRWNTVTLSLTTHDEGGLTDLDFKLAAAIDRL